MLLLFLGILDEKQGTISAKIARKEGSIIERCVDELNGQTAITHYEVLKEFDNFSIVQFVLETGRTHQIRVHFKHIGHPLFNDAEYGGDKILKGTTFTKYKQFVENCFKILPRQALHAKSLGFVHPATGEDIFFDSELPQDMQMGIEKWRTYTNSREYLE